jgi:D-alanyl-D-alanine carboxypeptidase
MQTSTRHLGKLLGFLILSLAIPILNQAQETMQQIDSLLRTIYPDNAPGASVRILRKGKAVFNKSYGLADLSTGTAITAQTNFNIASITKQFTAMAILQLVFQGKINLNDKLIKFFPDFQPGPGNLINIQHLLTHSSGILDHYDYARGPHLKHATDQDVLQAVKGIDSTYFIPGTDYRYSNTAYCLLALIIEKVTGLRYEDYLHKNIFLPLGMKQARVWAPDLPIPQPAIGYEFDSVRQQFIRADADESVFFSTQGDGGIYCSIDEYVKWFRGLQESRFLPKEWIRKARSKQFEIDKSRGLSYGYGWFIGEKEKPVVVYHTGSNGGFRSISFSIPGQDYLLLIFSNRTGVDLEELAIEINKMLRVGSKSFIKLESLISFQDCWPIFAPCKKTISYLTLFVRNWNDKDMALN